MYTFARKMESNIARNFLFLYLQLALPIYKLLVEKAANIL